MNGDVLHDLFKGCMVGLAVGDALGACAEFLTEHQVRERYGVVKDYHTTSYFEAGEFTDDTSMALAIAESIIEAESVEIETIADAFVEWMVTDGRGIGILTMQALREIEDGAAPLEAGLKAWERSGRKSAGNGAVMRCAPIALFDYRDQDALVSDSTIVSQITHYDPRCVWSCIALNTAIAAILRGDSDPRGTAMRAIKGSCEPLETALSLAADEDLTAMRLDGEDQGYTILTTQAAFAALEQYQSFEEGLIAVVNKGGDADTNGAVAGALLGAKYGLGGIPDRWVDGLIELDRVISAADGLYAIAG